MNAPRTMSVRAVEANLQHFELHVVIVMPMKCTDKPHTKLHAKKFQKPVCDNAAERGGVRS